MLRAAGTCRASRPPHHVNEPKPPGFLRSLHFTHTFFNAALLSTVTTLGGGRNFTRLQALVEGKITEGGVAMGFSAASEADSSEEPEAVLGKCLAPSP